MKKHIFFPIILCLVLGACKKGNDNLPAQDKFSFEMNGVKYSNASQGTFISANGNIPGYEYDYIEFNDPVSPGNVIRMYANSNNCAYRKPINEYGVILDFITCTLDFINPPSDSSQVYHKQSGSLVYSRSNCRSWYGNLTGQPDNYIRCDVSGTFSLTLVNHLGQTIIITNGEFLKH